MSAEVLLRARLEGKTAFGWPFRTSYLCPLPALPYSPTPTFPPAAASAQPRRLLALDGASMSHSDLLPPPLITEREQSSARPFPTELDMLLLSTDEAPDEGLIRRRHSRQKLAFFSYAFAAECFASAGMVSRPLFRAFRDADSLTSSFASAVGLHPALARGDSPCPGLQRSSPHNPMRLIKRSCRRLAMQS